MKKIIVCSIFVTTFFLSLQAQSWETLNNTKFKRHHTVSFSINNMGYSIAGTGPQGDSKNVQEYDPVNDSWKNLGNYPGPVRAQGIGQTWNGKGYFGFGAENGSALNDLWEFDPTSNTFTELAPCPCIGRTHPAFVILNGKIYVGMGSAGGNLADWWEYDITTKVWTQKKSIPIGRHHPYQFILNGNIYVGSGHQSSWYKYDPLNDTWTNIASLDTRVAGTQFNYNGKGYALSGVTTGHKFYATGEFYEYDPLSDTWNELTAHPGNSLWAPASFIINNYVYLYTGTTGATGTSIAGSYSSSMYRYQLSTITSTNSFSNEKSKLSFYPNPVSDKVNFNLKVDENDKAFIGVYNMLGVKVYESFLSKNEIDLSALKSGIYTVQILFEDKQFNEKIIKN